MNATVCKPAVKLNEVRRFMEDCLKAAGAPDQAAKEQADLLMHADTVGHYSHGLNRLEYYVNDCKSGACTPALKPKILNESSATAWVDGVNALGATVAGFCMNIAITKAKNCGASWVAAKQCNHFGMAGYWAEMALRDGLIGFALTNTSPLMVPTRSKKDLEDTVLGSGEGVANHFFCHIGTSYMKLAHVVVKRLPSQQGLPELTAQGAPNVVNTRRGSFYWTYLGAIFTALGTNPIAMAAPADKGDRMVVDLATTAVALGKIEIQLHKDEPLPDGWALGTDGRPTTDAKLAYKAAQLLPLGGGEMTSGHKGYALAAMIEILCSGLSGSKSSNKIRAWVSDDKSPPNLGQCFAAIDPDYFGPDFRTRISQNLYAWRNLDPVDPMRPVLVPGDMERENEENTLEKGTISYAAKQIESVNDLAKRLGVKPIRTEL